MNKLNISNDQVKFGYEKLKQLSVKLKLTEYQTVEVLQNLQELKSFYNWVNADLFLNEFQRQDDNVNL